VALRGKDVDPAQAVQLYRHTLGAFGTMLSAYLFSVSWFAFFFPQTFMSHFGFYWALSTISIVMRQLLVRYNYGHHYGQMPGARLLVWALGFVPVLVFLTYGSKFKPEQTSALSLSSTAPPSPRRRARRRCAPTRPRRATPSTRCRRERRSATSHERGERRQVPARRPRANDDRLRVGRRRHHQGEAAHVRNEAQFTTELEAFFRAAFARKVGVPARLADIGRVYSMTAPVTRGAARSAIHLEALARYREAFKYRDDDELRLAGAYSMLEMVRLMRRDNILNTYGLAHAAAVSYNKTRALAAHTLQYLGPPMADARNASEQQALAALAHFFGAEDRDPAKQLPPAAASDGRYLTIARAYLENSDDKSLSLWDDVARDDPDNSLPFAQQGMRLLGAGNLERADAAFSPSARARAENAEARVGAAAVLVARGQRAEGEKALDETARATSYNSEARVLGVIASYGHLLALLCGGCLLFAFFAGRIPIVYGRSSAPGFAWR